jgi:hypothetical protein
VFHSYVYGGEYKVTLTVRDVGGHETSESQFLTVIGPPAPGTGGSGGSGGSGPGSTTGSGGASNTPGSGAPGAGGAGAGAAIAAPSASAAVVSRTLHAVKKSGVVVAYSVNEQVAGHVEVLLGAALARRLGIKGPLATGLPLGSPPSIVLAKTLLITTKGGRSTVKVVLSKSNAKRLAHQRKVSMLLRMFVRNAAPKPATATVLASFTLTH